MGESEAEFLPPITGITVVDSFLIECTTPCYDAQAGGIFLRSSPVHMTVLDEWSEGYASAPQHLPPRLKDWTEINSNMTFLGVG